MSQGGEGNGVYTEVPEREGREMGVYTEVLGRGGKWSVH